MKKTAYEEKIRPNLGRIALMAGKGATVKEICKALDICQETLRRYLKLGEAGDERYTDLCTCIAQGRELADENVEDALYKRACGFEYMEERHEEKLDRMGNVVELITKTNRVVPPDPTSAMFWLTNRKPRDWRYQRREQEMEADSGCGVILIPKAEAQEAQEAGKPGTAEDGKGPEGHG